MHQASIEFVMPTDMVDMSMGGDGSGRTVQNVARKLAQACDSHTRVDDEIAIAPSHVPDVAA
jgi:hypothetical protein